MGTLISILVVGGIIWFIYRNFFYSSDSDNIRYLLHLCDKSYKRGQSRESIYTQLLELADEKKYSYTVIEDVIVYFLLPIVRQLLDEGMTPQHVLEVLVADGYDEKYVKSALLKV